MNPTFWGQHVKLVCPQCTAPTRFDIVFEKRFDASVCWHCGSKWPPDGLQPTTEGPDTLLVEPLQKQPHVGEIVLVSVNGQKHLKRIMAGPGQTIEATPDLTSMVQDDVANWPRLIVYNDRWSQTLERRWNPLPEPNRGWGYTHRNVYRGNRPVEILDDYPGNIGLSRRLRPATAIGVDFDWSDEVDPDVEFFVHDKVLKQARGERFQEGNSTNRIRFCSQKSKLDEMASLERLARPSIIIRSRERPQNIVVWRRVSYPLDGPKMTLGPDQWFVMGDNYPVSIDSREWGPIRSQQILGLVKSTRQVS